MSEPEDEVEALLEALEPDQTARGVLREEHRQLEKDLLRLADPLPPADFLACVMARVQAEPARRLSSRELVAGLLITTLLASGALLSVSVDGAAGLLSKLVQMTVLTHDCSVAAKSAVTNLWNTAPLPMLVALSLVLVSSLGLLRRVALQDAALKVP
jgi:hypothetical protein